ncbi:glycerol-3-phosphate acyltransferase [Brunnivagina elsteri]|uniref:Pyruvate phosphate dikinase PEP/pyruvate-binding protein n=1 Tax=Brunnivagina elsteri CCALA 953 TaxID=987040 RepID=A0A2A2THD4_9CYAN|nr:glycerol-3-phosphate acyltransferase [Calothrix elsteri]PAX52809.1 pyruvate phosphate dikinase PEP/pyruvate-binding protein [Calothrix elsteri CCALA 953]
MLELRGFLVIFVICPLLGALPLIAWITSLLSKKQLAQLGTGNIGVSAAFYHGGTLVGTLAVLSEAFKGIAAVLLARAVFDDGSAWELLALITLVLGRYFFASGAGTTNVVWGFAVHDPLAAIFVLLFAGISFTVIRSRQTAKYGVLIVFPIIVRVLHSEDGFRLFTAIALAGLLAWIYNQIPDDLDLPTNQATTESQAAMNFFRGDKSSVLTLDDELDADFVGNKAAKLAEIKRWGYQVPKGWVLLPYEDAQNLINILQPSELSPLVVRSSAIGEDTDTASAAGQYESILNVTTQQGLLTAINRTQASYNNPGAVQYRRDRNVKEAAMAVLVQQQIRSVYSGVAFSRDPITQEVDAIVIEALPGSPTQVVSGRVTPEQYRAFVVENDNVSFIHLEGQGKVPQVIIKQVAYLARHLEERYHGIPQDIEWSYDGQTLWVLQTRPITTLLPIWTRKIAAEVIPGLIRPLTWSINRPLTCGVWGGIFAIVLGERALGLDFNETATLHFSHAYFNATLLGQIFRRMGLPPESLEFLTRGAKMSKPPLDTTLRNLPGLLRLLGRELSLKQDFKRDNRLRFSVGMSQLSQEMVDDLDPPKLLTRIDYILELLQRATYYSILAPLSASLRQSIFKVKDLDIDNSGTPEVAAIRVLQELATQAKQVLYVNYTNEESSIGGASSFDPDNVFEDLAVSSEGQKILAEFEYILQRYGYLSEVGTDIAVPTWKEEPEAVKTLLVQFMLGNQPETVKKRRKKSNIFVQSRVNMKGQITEIYSRLLAELRWCFIALEKQWLYYGMLPQKDDIFFLEFEEIRQLIEAPNPDMLSRLQVLVSRRRSQLERDKEMNPMPLLVYGNTPPAIPALMPALAPDQILQGIPASPGLAEGRVKVLRNLQDIPEIEADTILVVPYTDSGWAPLLVRAKGIIADAGGRLSHGAILAREYGIPAIMDVKNATWVLQDGQRVRIDGSRGIIEIDNDLRPQ